MRDLILIRNCLALGYFASITMIVIARSYLDARFWQAILSIIVVAIAYMLARDEINQRILEAYIAEEE
jgi:hypothetical protein